MAQNGAKSLLTLKQARALEALVEWGAEQTMEDVARAAGVSRRTLYRFLSDPVFLRFYRHRVELELGAHRGRVGAALVKGATTRGPGQAAMQKLHWQRLGELVEAKSLEFEDAGEILYQLPG